MATTAKLSYSVIRRGRVFTYGLFLRNTSAPPFDIYAFLFGSQFNVPVAGAFPLKNITFVRSPRGWTPSLGTNGINYFTSFQGNAIASGYILPAGAALFTFTSSTPPPKKFVYGCCFYNGQNQWGFCFNGMAELVEYINALEFPA